MVEKNAKTFFRCTLLNSLLLSGVYAGVIVTFFRLGSHDAPTGPSN